MRAWYKSITPVYQTGNEGAIPSARSSFEAMNDT